MIAAKLPQIDETIDIGDIVQTKRDIRDFKKGAYGRVAFVFPNPLFARVEFRAHGQSILVALPVSLLNKIDEAA